MARQGSAERREPSLGGSARAEADLRLRPEDRPSPPPKRSARPRQPTAPAWDTDDGRPPSRRRSGRPPGKGRKGGKADKPRSLFARMVTWVFVLGLWAALAGVAVVAWYAAHLPPMSELRVPERPPNIQIVGADGETLINRGAMGRSLRIEEMPRHLKEAVLAIEDRRFYSHFGVDPIGIARALVRNIVGGGVSEGGSTITQQLAKNLFLTHERSMERKIQELVLSLWIEARFSKDQILELYLNRVYLGAGTYGVEAASQRYFGKSARNISLHEAAILAGLLQAPSRLAPSRNPRAAEARARIVLGAMADAGFVRAETASLTGRQNVRVVPADASGSSVGYAADWVMDQLAGIIGAFEKDIIVETTLDPHLQREAERALREALERQGERLNVSQGAVVVMDANGAVRALVGGRNYAESQYNRAVTARRQPGSAFKPFVYLAALERGLTAETRRDDTPITIRGWSPENYSREFRGSTSLRDSLAMSLNTIAVKLGIEVGPRTVVRTAERLGITSPLLANPSIALGTSEVSLLELTGAYVPFSNGGSGVIPHVVRSIKTVDGKVLFQRAGTGPGRVVSQRDVAQMNAMLAHATAVGTARRAQVPGWAVAGKTGTSQEFRDAWFVGYTATHTTGVWIGNDDSSPTRRASGSGVPTEIWSRVMTAAHRGLPPMALPGAGEAPLPPSPGERSIDDIVFGTSPGERNPARQTPPVEVGSCPIDANFLGCLFSGGRR
jgi:penicillin-binding protein 1A